MLPEFGVILLSPSHDSILQKYPTKTYCSHPALHPPVFLSNSRSWTRQGRTLAKTQRDRSYAHNRCNYGMSLSYSRLRRRLFYRSFSDSFWFFSHQIAFMARIILIGVTKTISDTGLTYWLHSSFLHMIPSFGYNSWSKQAPPGLNIPLILQGIKITTSAKILKFWYLVLSFAF